MTKRAVICVGDPTTHGGKVLEGDPKARAAGRPIAKRGHMTWCPKCTGKFPISEGSAFMTFAGVNTALEGMRTACGAQLIATATRGFLEVDDGRAAPTDGGTHPGADAHTGLHSGAFRAVDEATGVPLAGLPYRIELPDGRTLSGATDAEGYTQSVKDHDPATIRVYWGDPA